jgi:ribosomal protein S18 acetylase RimI-like enzyme
MMNIQIRPFDVEDITEIVELSLLAWEPVFDSFKHVLGLRIYQILYPDWKKSQADVVEKICLDQEKYHVLVADFNKKVVGFLVYEINPDDLTGEVQLLAVHPSHQNQGIGTKLNLVALQEMKMAGMRLAVVGTGGEEGHAPARRSYEKAGYTPLPLVRYYKDLKD